MFSVKVNLVFFCCWPKFVQGLYCIVGANEVELE